MNVRMQRHPHTFEAYSTHPPPTSVNGGGQDPLTPYISPVHVTPRPVVNVELRAANTVAAETLTESSATGEDFNDNLVHGVFL